MIFFLRFFWANVCVFVKPDVPSQKDNAIHHKGKCVGVIELGPLTGDGIQHSKRGNPNNIQDPDD
jgi:hypothetical protein